VSRLQRHPEDYTNRGRIVTPLKDRSAASIGTHYPLTREEGIAITDANAWSDRHATGEPRRPRRPRAGAAFVKEVWKRRPGSPAVRRRSTRHPGVSVRMSIANFENVVSSAERRGVVTGREPGRCRGSAT